jgi:hypothetical protein
MVSELTVEAATLALAAAKNGNITSAMIVGYGPHGGVFRLATPRTPTDIFALLALMDTMRLELLSGL